MLVKFICSCVWYLLVWVMKAFVQRRDELSGVHDRGAAELREIVGCA